MNLQKFTLKAQEALRSATEIAQNGSNQTIEPVHLLAALLADTGGIVPPLVMKIGANPGYLSARIQEEIASLPRVSGGTGERYISGASNRLLDNAIKEATDLSDEYVSTEHILL